MNEEKTLDNTCVDQAKDQVSDLKVYGNGDMFKLVSKASSKVEGWMKSTKVCEVSEQAGPVDTRAVKGCLVQVTTQQGEHVAEALAWLPGVTLKEITG